MKVCFRLLPNVNNVNSSVGIPKPLASSPRWGAKETEAKMEDIHNGLMQRASRQTTTTPAGVGLLREKERWFIMVGPRGKEHTVCVCVSGMHTHWGVCQGTCSWQSCTWPRPPGRMSCTGSSCGLESAQQHTSHDTHNILTLRQKCLLQALGFPIKSSQYVVVIPHLQIPDG